MARILIVDDDPDFVEITRMILEPKGYQVSSAANGEQALIRMRQHRPDLVLLDVMMSHVLDGLDVSRQMQKDAELSDIPIIMVSSIADSPHAEVFPTDEYLPIDGWISKPLQSDTLLEKVRRCLSARTPERVGWGSMKVWPES
jgi:adenylate cyclase